MLLEINGLSTYYDNIAALKAVDIRVAKGQIVAIIGANGAGKSTLLKTISGLVRPRAGTIRLRDIDLCGLAPERIVAHGVTQVPEGRQIFAHLSVLDNLHLGAYLYHKRRHRSEIKTKIQTLYRMFPILQRRAQQIAGTLSGGEQQMLAIARALMGRPELLLLDEPSMGLAPLIVRDIFSVLRRLNADGTTILLVEQNARAALTIADYAYVLETGSVTLEGPAGELLDNPRVKASYLGG